ncbi:hypothetical protein Tco_0723121, partial [Tanacetum coccineum]
ITSILQFDPAEGPSSSSSSSSSSLSCFLL